MDNFSVIVFIFLLLSAGFIFSVVSEASTKEESIQKQCQLQHSFILNNKVYLCEEQK